MAVTLLIFAFTARWIIWGMNWGTGDQNPLREAARIAGFARHDALVIAVFTLIALILNFAANRLQHGARTVRVIVWGSYFVIGAMMALNVIAIEVIGSPISRKLLVLADWFRSFTPLSAIQSVMSVQNVIGVVAAVAVLAFLPRILTPIIRWFVSGRLGVGVVALASLAILGWYAALTPITGPTRSLARIENPTVVLVRSLVRKPQLDIADYAPARHINGRELDAIDLADTPAPTTIIIIVMESIGADAAYGQSQIKRAGLMPNLTNLANDGVRFTGAYTPVSASTISGATLLSGRFPGYPPATQVQTLSRETIASHLASQGWQAGFFMSGDLAFQGFEPYLRARGFVHTADMTAGGCATELEIDDRCTAKALARWLSTNKAERRLAVVWSGQAHYPYYDADMSGTSPDAVLARYERAVRYSDAMLGDIVADLRARGTLDDTLLVVTGDHGEAFDEHGFQLHANSAHIEEVRVPLVMRHPRLPAGISLDRAASTMDVAATIMAVAGLGETFGQGRNLLSAGRERPAFSAVFGDRPMLSYRIGNTSTLLSLDDGSVRQFDLNSDPHELSPEEITGAKRERALAVFARLARNGQAGAE